MAYVSRGFIPQTSLASNLGFTRPMYIPAGNATATALYDIVKLALRVLPLIPQAFLLV